MKRAFLPILVWFACLLAAGAWVAATIEVDHDLAAFLPDRDLPIERLLISRANQGAVSRTILIAFEGGRLEQRLAASREAAESLSRLSGIEQAINGGEGLDLTAFDALFPYRYLLGDAASFDARGLQSALTTRLKELRSPLGSTVKATLASDPTASFRTLLLGWNERQAGPPREEGLWVTPDRERALLIATIGEIRGDPGREDAIIQAIRATLTDIAERQDVTLLLAGRPMLIAAAQETVRANLIFGSIGAGGAVVLLLLFVYRSFGVLLLGILPLVSGVVFGLFAVLVLFGLVHGIALAFGVTLLGIAIDYPLHLFSHAQKGEPLTRTARSIQRPIFLGALTTAGAFAIFGTSSAPGLGQLACFTGTGIMTAALTLRFVVPNLADFLGIVPAPRMVDLLPAKAPRAMMWLAIILAVAAGALLISRQDRLFETDVGVLNPLPEAAKQLDLHLRTDLGAPDLRYLFLISAEDADTVLERAEGLTPLLDDLRAAGGITGFDTPSRYLPSLALQAERQAALPVAGDLEAALAKASQGLPFKAGLFEPFSSAVQESRTIQPLDAKHGQELFGKTALGARVEQLLLHADDQWYGFVPVSGVADMAGLQDLAARADGVELIDLKLFSEDILDLFRNEAYILFAQGSAIVLLLLAAFRYPPMVIARIFLVLALSITITIGALALFGEKLTMLHILAALLVIGLGLDYTIFFSWPDADEHQSIRTRHALLVCVVSTVLVFGLLALSSIDLLRAIGLTVALGACTTFAVAYAILSRQNE